MFNIDFDDSRVKATLRTLQYSVLTILVILGTIILVLAGQGYDLDPGTGQVIRNGLILVNSTPEGAQVTINGVAESDLTPASFPVPDGEYEVSINLGGYRPWQKNLQLDGSEVEWLYYPLLIPSSLETDNLTVFLRPEFIGPSPSGETLLVRQSQARPVLNLLEFSASGVSNERDLSLSAELLNLGSNQAPGKFGFAGWADDERHALLTHSRGGRIEYIWLDVQNVALSRNLNDDFGLNLDDVRFIDGDSNRLIGLVDGDLRRINLDSDTISAPVIRSVDRYVLHEDRFIVFIQNREPGSQLGLIEGDNEAQILEELPRPAGNYRLEFAQFDDVFYLALLDRSSGQASLAANPHVRPESEAESPLVFNLTGASQISFSRNGQFITIQAGQRFLTYDLDYKRRYSFRIDYALAAAETAQWLDGYRLSLVGNDGVLRAFEFDGQNSTELIEVNPAFTPIYSGAQNILFSLSPAAEGGRVFLQGTPFTVPEN